jgi:KDO2-lipid IV(A) lauroyltransferase
MALRARALVLLGSDTFAPVSGRSPDDLRTMLHPEGLDHLDRLRSSGRGAILLGTHAGLYAWAGPVLTRLGYRIWLTHRRHTTADIALLLRREGLDRLVLPFPEQHEGGIFLKDLHGRLRRGEWLRHTGDEPDHRRGLQGMFLGREVKVVRAPWQLARMTGAPVVPLLLLMDEEWRPRLVVGEPIHAARGGPAEASEQSALQRYLDFVGKHVRSTPWNLHSYIWALWFAEGEVRRFLAGSYMRRMGID